MVFMYRKTLNGEVCLITVIGLVDTAFIYLQIDHQEKSLEE